MACRFSLAPQVAVFNVNSWTRLTLPTSNFLGGNSIAFSSNVNGHAGLFATGLSSTSGQEISIGTISSAGIVTKTTSFPTLGRLVNAGALAFAPNGARLAVGFKVDPDSPDENENFIRVFETTSWTSVISKAALQPAIQGAIQGITFSNSGHLAALVGGAGKVHIYETNSWTVTQSLNTRTTQVAGGVAFSADDTVLAVTHINSPFFTLFETTSWQILDNPATMPSSQNAAPRTAWAPTGFDTRARMGFVRNPSTGNLNPVSQSRAAGNDYNIFNNYVYDPVPKAIYRPPEIDLGTNLEARIWADIAANQGPVSSGSANYQLQIDYKTSTGSYDGFENWTVGDVGSLQFVKARIVSNMSSGTDITRLTGFNPTVDAEEREEHAETVTINSGGSTVNFTKNFALVPAVGIWNAEASAKVPGLGTVTTSGFVGHVFSASGTNIGGTVNWRAVGV